jgi:GT2 family glycosyltransferase
VSPPRASIVIVCFGKRELTERCLLSLERALGRQLGRAFELVLVDNASPDTTLELLDAWRDRATVVALPENRDFAGGCNAGAAAARGEALVFLNNDTVVEPDTLEPLVETALEPGVGAAGLRLLFADGTVQHAGVAMVENPNLGGAASPYHVFRGEDGDTPAARGTYELDCVTGACIAIPRVVFEQLKGFDDGYHNGYEDVDLCLRIRMSGRTIVYRGDLAFLHDEGQTRGGIDDLPNVQRLMRSWRHLLEPDLELAATAWDATLAFSQLPRTQPSTAIVVAGQPNGIGPAADEARALLLALERCGAPAVAADYGLQLVRPRVAGATGEALERALTRAMPEQAVLISVPAGPTASSTVPAGAWVRLPTASLLAAARNVLAAAPAHAEWIPPAIDAPPAAGTGGGGVLVSLPAHDEPRTRALLAALAASTEEAVTLVPTVATRGLDRLVAELLPHARLSAPSTDEERWMALAAAADVAVCVDPDDRFERRALTAAAAGATPILATGDGPAGAVLGRLAEVMGATTLACTIAAARAAADRREQLGERVRATCDPAAVGMAMLQRLAAPAAAAA